MTIAGSTYRFADFFPDYLIPEILNIVFSAWNIFQKPEPTETEVSITRRFLKPLRDEKTARDLPFTIDREVWESPDPETGSETGRIDLRFLHGHQENVYFGFECKRLNVRYPSGFATNAQEYVGDDGMMCFVTRKYANDLNAGGMIGYVMDGNIAKAVGRVKVAIDEQRCRLCLTEGTGLDECSILPNEERAKQTTHTISTPAFMIYHLFLGVS